MITTTRTALALGTLLPTLLAPGLAHADNPGPAGRVTALEISAEGSTNFSKYRGAVTVRRGSDRPQTYHFGGAFCPGKNLTEGQIQLLMDALAKNGRIKIQPKFLNGQGGSKCLVAFTLRNVKRKGKGKGAPKPRD